MDLDPEKSLRTRTRDRTHDVKNVYKSKFTMGIVIGFLSEFNVPGFLFTWLS